MKTYYFSDWDKANWENNTLNKAYRNQQEFTQYLKEEEMISESNEIHYYVQTTGERYFDYRPLKYIYLYDYEHKLLQALIKNLEGINKYNSVLMEDDLILCKDFQKEIEEVIAKYPNCVISFFEDSHVFETPVIRSTPFGGNKCTYYPKGVARKIATMIKQMLSKNPKDQQPCDRIEDIALQLLGIPHLIWKPHLVQCCDFNQFNNSTVYFKDYLDELKINYMDCYNKNDIKNLLELNKKRLTEEKEKYDKKMEEIKEKD